MINIMKCFYNEPQKLMDSQLKKFSHTLDYLEAAINSISEMFKYTTTYYDEIDINNIEYILRMWGVVGFTMVDSKVCYGFAYLGGKPNKRFIGNKVTIQFLDGTCKSELEVGKDCIVGFNNSTRTADRLLFWFSKQFCETDISQVNNVTFSRQAPIFVAKTNRVKQFIQDSFEKIRSGKLMTIADDSLTMKDAKVVDTINLTDINSIDKLQYLDTYHNALLRRIYTLYGVPLAEGMKLAQQSVGEVTSNYNASKIIPLNNLKMRKKMCEDLRNFFNIEISVEFCDLLADTINNVESGVDNETESI